MNEPNQQKIVDLDRGLFLVNYRSAEDPSAPPRVSVAPVPGYERFLEILLHPDAREPVLKEPNTALVVRVNSPAKLKVQVLPKNPGGSRAAMVRIEPVHYYTGAPASSVSVTAVPAAEKIDTRPALDLGALKLRGHVAGIGDVAVGANAWIAGPSAPSRIEGIALEWPTKPPELDIRYAVQFPNAQPGSGRIVPLGTFAGTRGRALPLTGVVLEMSGDENLQFVAEAVFLSAPTLRAAGKRVVLSGPTGREPLVGLRLTVEPIAAAEPVEAPPALAPANPPPPVRKPAASPGRVRVFRSKPRQDASVG